MPETEKININHIAQDALIFWLATLAYATVIVFAAVFVFLIAYEIAGWPLPEIEADVPVQTVFIIMLLFFGVYTKVFYALFKRRPQKKMKHFLCVLFVVLIINAVQLVAMKFEISWLAASLVSDMFAFVAAYGLFQHVSRVRKP